MSLKIPYKKKVRLRTSKWMETKIAEFKVNKMFFFVQDCALKMWKSNVPMHLKREKYIFFLYKKLKINEPTTSI